MSSANKPQLIAELQLQLRHVTANSVLLSEAVADKVGLHPTDNECLDLLLMDGAATAGQLSERLGLTTGAVTAMLDRLERAGFVRREHDPKDRRKVIVIPNTDKIYAEIAPHLAPMGEAFEAICADYSEAELTTILDFMTKANAAATQVIASLR